MGLRSLASTLIERYQFARQHGITFGGKRDMYDALGYARVLTPMDYRERYERGDIAARIVEALPKATWRGTGELVEDEDPDNVTDFEQAWFDLNDKLKIWSVLARADILSGINRYAVVLIGTKGDISSELDKGKPGELLYLTPFPEDDAVIESYVTDSADERFGLPLTYQLKRTRAAGGTGVSANFGRSAHWSRVLHIACDTLDDAVFGQPRLQRVWNRLDDLDKVSGGGAEAFWLRAHQGYQLKLDPDVVIEPDSAEAKALNDEVDEYVNGMRRYVRTRGMEMQVHSSDVADFSRPIDALLTLIAGATGIPKRILVGSEMGQLASTQDRSNWRDQVQDRRDGWASPQVLRPFVDRLIEYGYLPEPKEYEVRWPTIQFLDETERAEVANKWATINAAYKGEAVIEPNEIRDRLLDLPPLKARQEALVQPAPEVAPAKVPPGMKAALPKPNPFVAQPKPATGPAATDTIGAKPVDGGPAPGEDPAGVAQAGVKPALPKLDKAKPKVAQPKAAADWDPALHPQAPAGSPDGGQFTSSGGAASSAVDSKPAPSVGRPLTGDNWLAKNGGRVPASGKNQAAVNAIDKAVTEYGAQKRFQQGQGDKSYALYAGVRDHLEVIGFKPQDEERGSNYSTSSHGRVRMVHDILGSFVIDRAYLAADPGAAAQGVRGIHQVVVRYTKPAAK
jgi:hypothetical protein